MTSPSLLLAFALAMAPSARTARPATTASSPTAAKPATANVAPAPATTGPVTPDTPGGNADTPSAKPPEVTRYEFTGLDIEGELRTPALLQFLARIAGEFETMGIPHRSFMPELRSTTSEDAL